ncbi:MAG: hypothetical protein OEM41_04445 [Ignavibacteria bacterium]|nr:hypothetical protein [Ignavibacteria bacterium]
MVPSLRNAFNHAFTEEKYRRLLARLDREVGFHIGFRVCESPLFLPAPLVKRMISAGNEIIQQLMSNPTYLADSTRAIPHEFFVPNETPHPAFVAVDFGIMQAEDGSFEPRLVEMQGFPSLFAYQPLLSERYQEVYGLSSDLRWLLSGLRREEYDTMFRAAVLGGHAPEHVVLLELDPEGQKTRPDFVLTERLCGIATVNIREVIVEANHMFYFRNGRRLAVYRVYNRAIADELVRSEADLPFSFRDDIQVEWAGHPNWFFRLSKFSLPYLDHPCVPETVFLSEVAELPDDLDRWVLKPLFSFAGSGVKVGLSAADLDAIPDSERHRYILQRRVEYGAFVDTPYGGTKAEVRILYIWLDHPVAVLTLVRMGRGKMMGVDHNKDMKWVGSSAGLHTAG